MSLFYPSRSSLTTMTVTGSGYISGSLWVSGSIYVTGSSKFGVYLTDDALDGTGNHQFTGSVYLSGNTIFGSNYSHDHRITGSVQISGSSMLDRAIPEVTITGSTSISGSTIFGSDSSKTHQFTGSVYLSGNTIFGSNYSHDHRITGSVQITGSSMLDRAIPEVTITGSTSISGSTIFGSDSSKTHQFTGSVYMSTSQWVSGSVYITGSLYTNDILTFETGTLELYGDEKDGGSAVGVIAGSTELYTTPGAIIFLQTNGTGGYDRAYTDYKGQKSFCMSDYGGATVERYSSELVSITGSDVIYTSNVIPAGALCYGVGAYVVTTFQTASLWSIGTSGSSGDTSWYKWGGNMSGTAGTNNITSSMSQGFEYYSTNTPVTIKTSVLQSNAAITGSIRVEIRYRMIVPPNS